MGLDGGVEVHVLPYLPDDGRPGFHMAFLVAKKVCSQRSVEAISVGNNRLSPEALFKELVFKVPLMDASLLLNISMLLLGKFKDRRYYSSCATSRSSSGGSIRGLLTGGLKGPGVPEKVSAPGTGGRAGS